MLTLYDNHVSQNGYKVRLLLHQLEIPYTHVEIDIFKGESRTPEFLLKNPNGRIPVLELTPGQFLAESDAILFYLSEGTPLLPEDKFHRAQVLQWLFFEQYSHEPNIATVRFWYHVGKVEQNQAAIEQKRKAGYAALAVMEQQLTQHPFFVADCYTIADIALFAYTCVAHEGEFDLTPYPAVLAWLDRVRAQPRAIE
ncbi:glutathione S-transferase family protein [Anthocerotibacter panamensis]|uniref:glutathione S-transferase family protein n=1 Tax=Anthocerotibacter panamensis TaxID=2857077 RepID=UPI001C4073F6|nr:glutathione S-transferase family protein [Anthocerotibacter panamensis]